MSLFRNTVVLFSFLCSLQVFADVIKHPTCNLYLMTQNGGITNYNIKIRELFKIKNYNVLQMDAGEFRQNAKEGDLVTNMNVLKRIVRGERDPKKLFLKHKMLVRTNLSILIQQVETISAQGELNLKNVSGESSAFQVSEDGADLKAWEIAINNLPDCLAI